MKQPEMGLKVAELRQIKGITQEYLAEICEVSTRTIQRIESGEVDPRSFTINRLNEALNFKFGASDLENENLWLAALHLSSTISIVFIPLLIWSLMKDRSYKIEKQGKAVLNFQITVTLCVFAFVIILMLVPFLLNYIGEAGWILIILACLTVPIFIFGFFTFYQGIANTARSLNDGEIHYPFSIKFVK